MSNSHFALNTCLHNGLLSNGFCVQKLLRAANKAQKFIEDWCLDGFFVLFRINQIPRESHQLVCVFLSKSIAQHNQSRPKDSWIPIFSPIYLLVEVSFTFRCIWISGWLIIDSLSKQDHKDRNDNNVVAYDWNRW